MSGRLRGHSGYGLAVGWRRWRARTDPVLVAIILVPVVAFASYQAYYAFRDPNQGMSTRCGDFLKMDHVQQVAVMKKAQIPINAIDGTIRYRVDECHGSPSHTSIGEPEG
jgi:hypothetical protein